MSDGKLALVIGAAGGVGFETARALLRHGWQVRALARDIARAPRLDGAVWVQGDALRADDVMAAARGADVIVHAVNPPGYKNWPKLVPAMLANTIAAAEANDARIVLPGTVYNYGPDVMPVVREGDAQNPRTRKGKIRVEMERALEESDARVLILRAGDFFGPHAGNSWFAQGMVKAGAPLKSVVYPGVRHVGHAWAYLPDFAETIARLLARESDLARFERFHLGGHYFERGVDFAECVREATGNAHLPIRSFPWLALLAMAPFAPLFREMAEMRYLWRRDLKLDNLKLVRFLGAEPHTPIISALRATLSALACLPLSKAPGPGGERELSTV
ncbi:MAG: NAD(P)H-binding protein [Hyphomonadaceae bacterium JAD_PAG50586_4]|nr:MAG: NAD(P)H-binding protein [Hyphomonadaceae bacterium JAD_PAG50586_4]